MFKTKLVSMTKEELETFQKDFLALLEKHSAYFEAVPKIVRGTKEDAQVGMPFQLGGDILVLKKVKEETKDEVKKD